MRGPALVGDESRAALKAAVESIEAGSSAEVVVAIRPCSGSYRGADLTFGFFLAELALGLILFLPQEFWLETIPIDLALFFVLGAVVAAHSPWLRRGLTRERTRRARVLAAARATFVERGVLRTRGRTGILVYVSLLERRVELVADAGVPEEAMGEPWRRAVAGLEAALDAPAATAFAAALRELGPPLARALPRADDDENELPDEVSV